MENKRKLKAIIKEHRRNPKLPNRCRRSCNFRLDVNNILRGFDWLHTFNKSNKCATTKCISLKDTNYWRPPAFILLFSENSDKSNSDDIFIFVVINLIANCLFFNHHNPKRWLLCHCLLWFFDVYFLIF